MLTEKDKNIILDKLIQSFNDTGYIADVCFNDCEDEFQNIQIYHKYHRR